MIIYLDFVSQGEEGEGKKSILDMDPEVQAMMEMTGKTLHSQGLREPEEDQDQWRRPHHVGARENFDTTDYYLLTSDPVSSTLFLTAEILAAADGTVKAQDLSHSQGWVGVKAGGAMEPLRAKMYMLLFVFSPVCVRQYSHKARLFFVSTYPIAKDLQLSYVNIKPKATRKKHI